MNKNYVLLPVFNDWRSLNKVLKILNNDFKKNKSTNHVIIVNDASTSKVFLNKNYNFITSIKVLTLKKNVGSQKAIFFGLKYLQKKLKKNNLASTISVLDSDGEDNPRMIKKMIKLVIKKKRYFIFASRKKRTENNLLKTFNHIRLFITFILTGKYINFGNFSSFSSTLLNKILSNNNLCLAFSSGVLKNYNKFFFVEIKKNKRFYESSKVSFEFLITHALKIISVFYKEVFFRTLFLLLISLAIFDNIVLKIVTAIFFIIINSILIAINIFYKPKKTSLSFIKNVK